MSSKYYIYYAAENLNISMHMVPAHTKFLANKSLHKAGFEFKHALLYMTR